MIFLSVICHLFIVINVVFRVEYTPHFCQDLSCASPTVVKPLPPVSLWKPGISLTWPDCLPEDVPNGLSVSRFGYSPSFELSISRVGNQLPDSCPCPPFVVEEKEKHEDVYYTSKITSLVFLIIIPIPIIVQLIDEVWGLSTSKSIVFLRCATANNGFIKALILALGMYWVTTFVIILTLIFSPAPSRFLVHLSAFLLLSFIADFFIARPYRLIFKAWLATEATKKLSAEANKDISTEATMDIPNRGYLHVIFFLLLVLFDVLCVIFIIIQSLLQ